MLFYMLESLKKQTVQPCKVLLNISKGAYLKDQGIKALPDWLNWDCIEVHWVENTGPYRKLLPTINECAEDDIIITADDDVLYHPEWLSSLVSAGNKYPEHLVCARARVIKKSIFGGWQNYSRWSLVNIPKSGMDILPTGCAGIMYKKSLLDLEFLNDRKFMKIAATTDDLWFRMASMRRGVAARVEPTIDSSNIYLSHAHGLWELNHLSDSDGFFNKACRHTVGIVRDYIGLDHDENDKAWSRINRYSNKSLR